MTRFLLFSILLFGVSLLSTPLVNAQAEDLTLPGDEAPVVVNTGDDSTTDGGVAQESGSLLDMVLDGGWAMIPLFAMLFAVIALSFFMLLDLKKSTFVPQALADGMLASAEMGDLNGIAEQARSNPSCLGQVMNGACEYIFDRGYQVLDGDSIYDLMAEASQEFNRRRVSLLNYLSVISQAAPMVGLLGTVSGMIKAFGTLKQSGMGDPGQLAGNISEALVTTASGLIVALPAIFAFFFFRDKLVALVASVDKQCSKTLNTLRRAVIGGAGGGGGQPVAPVPTPQPVPPSSPQPVPPANPEPVPPAGPTPVPPAQQ